MVLNYHEHVERVCTQFHITRAATPETSSILFLECQTVLSQCKVFDPLSHRIIID